MFLLFFLSRSLITTSVLVVSMPTLILWYASRAFSQKLETDIPQDTARMNRTIMERKERWTEITKDFQSLQKLANMINHASGHSVTFFTIMTFLSYALNLDTILMELRNPSWDNVIVFMIYFLWDFFVFLLAADVCRNVSVTKLINSRSDSFFLI